MNNSYDILGGRDGGVGDDLAGVVRDGVVLSLVVLSVVVLPDVVLTKMRGDVQQKIVNIGFEFPERR